MHLPVLQPAHLFVVLDLNLHLHLALQDWTVRWDYLVHLDQMVLKVPLVNLVLQDHQALQVRLVHQQVHLATMDRPGQWALQEIKVHQVIQVRQVHWDSLVLQDHQAWLPHVLQYVRGHASELVLPPAAMASRVTKLA